MSSLLDALKFIQPALATKDTQLGLRYVRLEPGWVSAANGTIAAKAPAECEVDCLVDGAKLVAALERMDGSPAISIADGVLKIRKGRLSASLNTLPVGAIGIDSPEGAWDQAPSGLVPALRQLRPFLADAHPQAWATAICLIGNVATATTGTVIAEATIAGMALGEEALLPGATADFLLGEAPPAEYMQGEGYLAFRWPDGRWLRSQLLSIAYPNVAGVLSASWQVDGDRVEDTLRSALDDVAALSPDAVVLDKAGIHGNTEQGTFSCEVPLPSMGELRARWNPKTLACVLGLAASWHPAKYPAPVPFTAPGIRGVAMGRS